MITRTSTITVQTTARTAKTARIVRKITTRTRVRTKWTTTRTKWTTNRISRTNFSDAKKEGAHSALFCVTNPKEVYKHKKILELVIFNDILKSK